MKKNEPSKIRNIAIVGHGKSGKTSLAEAMLFSGKATDRLCRVDNGESVLDWEQEEKDRRMTIMCGFHHFDWKKCAVNVIDTPGDSNFVADTVNSLQIVDAAVLVIDASSGVQVITEKLWQLLKTHKIPTVIFINKIDRENTDFYSVLEDIKNTLGVNLTPLTIPIGKEAGFNGLVDLVKMKGMRFAADDSGSLTDGDIPADMSDQVEDLRQQLIENIAESDEALLEKYLEGGDLSLDEISATMKKGAKEADLIGVMCGSAVKNYGVQPLMDFIVQNLPSPLERAELGVLDAKTGEPSTVAISENGPLMAYVFKTIADPYAGKLTLFRVFSGELSSDASVYNATRDIKEKFGNILRIEGKNQSAIDAAVAGDIVAVAKLKETSTGDTLCEPGSGVRFKSLTFPRPVTSYAVMAKTRADEDKMASSLHRLMEEDPTLLLEKNEATREFVLSGVGQVHIDVTAARLKRKFGVEMEMKLPKIAYKETIKGKTRVQGKHKKQSGGRGQFADTWIEMEPLPSGGGFEFVNKIVGGAIPRNYIPAVEKGIANQMVDGILAGFPIVDVRVSLVDGGYHDVDSSDMAFQIAGSKGFKAGFAQCNPILLEPIMQVEITVPDDLTGDVMGDVNSRRGRVLGMEQGVGGQMVKALVPQSEMLTYSADLTSMTSGRGLYTMEFDHYEELPHNLAEKVIAESQKEEK